MSLAHPLNQSLNDPALAAEPTVTATAGPWQATASTNHRDRIGAELTELAVARATPGPGTVRAWADQFANQSRGLPDPVKLLEVDPSRDEAILRSTPNKTERRVDYYEVKMQGTSKASVKRYAATDGKRESIPFTITHEGLGRLVDDLAGSQK